MLDFIAQCKSESSKRNQKYALRSLQQYIGEDIISESQLTKDTIDNYSNWLIKTGKTNNTIELYRKELRFILTACYPELTQKIKEAFTSTPFRKSSGQEGLSVNQLQLLAKAEFGDSIELTQVRDLFIFALYCGGLDYNTIKQLTKDKINEGYLLISPSVKIPINNNIKTILSEYEDIKSPLIFPFCKTLKELEYVGFLNEIGAKLHIRRIKKHHSEAKAWISVARHCGISLPIMSVCAAKRVGILKHYTGETECSQKEIDKAINKVCLAISDNTQHWYAMKLRRSVVPEDVLEILCNNSKYTYLRNIPTYYPMYDVETRIGNKLKHATKAYISSVLFFRVRPQYVKQISELVQQYAWIYRQLNTASSPYAIISQNEMENFQRTISCFTDDVEISLIGNKEIGIGKKVKLLTGNFVGCEGIIEDEKSSISDLRNFVIRFTSENSLRIKISVNETQIKVLD